MFLAIRTRGVSLAIALAIIGSSLTMAQPAPAEVTKGEAAVAKRSAKLYISQRQYNKAIEQYEVAVQGRPDDAEALYYLGWLYGEKESFDNMNKNFNVIEAMEKEKKWKKEIESYRKELWVRYYNLAVKGLNAQKYDFAIEQFNNAIKCNANEADAYEGLGIAFLNTDKLDEGIDSYKKAIELNATRGQSFYNISIALLNAQKPQEALDYLKRGHQTDPKDLLILQQMAVIENQLGNKEAAGIAAEKALAVDPKNPTVLNIAAQIFLTAENYEKASGILEKVIEQEPDNTDAVFNLALAYNNLNQKEKALGLYKKSLAANPNDTDALYQLGRLNLEIENFDEAITCAEKVSELQPANYRAWGLLYQSLAKKSENATGKEAEELVKKATSAYEMFEALKSQEAEQ